MSLHISAGLSEPLFCHKMISTKISNAGSYDFHQSHSV